MAAKEETTTETQLPDSTATTKQHSDREGAKWLSPSDNWERKHWAGAEKKAGEEKVIRHDKVHSFQQPSVDQKSFEMHEEELLF